MSGAFLALDWGQKKVGFATADGEGIVISPRGRFLRKAAAKDAWSLSTEDRKQLAQLIADYECEHIVLGLPLRPGGLESGSTDAARTLARALETHFKLDVTLIDESNTSWEARSAANDDARAAALLLEDFFAQKKRKAGRAGFSLLGTLGLIALLAALAFGAYYYPFAVAPMSDSQGTYIMDVAPGSTISTLREDLGKNEMPVDRYRLKIWLMLKGYKNLPLRVGEYQIEKSWPAARAFEELLHGRPLLRRVVVKEGYNIYDIKAEFNAAKGRVAADDFLKLTRDNDLLALAKVPGTVMPELRSLEGYLFPETYSFSKYDSLTKITKAMITEFNRRARPILQEHMWSRTPEGFYKLLILASIVEKESGSPAEQPLVASVFWNRINKKMRLQSDPTTIYGLLPEFDGNIRKADLLRPTPYNTYTLAGLPATPISSPGETALRAVVHPAQTKYLYFVAKGDGSHVFSEDFKTHNSYVDEYQRKRRAAKQP